MKFYFSKKNLIILVFILTSAFVFYFLLKTNRPKNTKTICQNSACFKVKIAQTSRQQKTGLMFLNKLDADQGLFFDFPDIQKHSIWMKNTLIPLDIIWLDEDLKILEIKENAKPCLSDPCLLFTPQKNSKYVLELQAGAVNRFELKPQDQFIFK